MVEAPSERPAWFDPYYDERQYDRRNEYLHTLHERFPTLAVRPRQAETMAGHWKEHFTTARGEDPSVGAARPLHVEIGCGLGEFLAWRAQSAPEINLVGLEIRFKRLYKTAQKIERIGAQNRVRLVRYDAGFMPELFGSEEIDHLYAFHPDPWPKERHHKHRLFSPEYMDVLRSRLAARAEIEIKTDHAGYFQVISDLFSNTTDFEVLFHTPNLHASARADRFPMTVFERLFVARGTPIGYIHVRRRPPLSAPGADGG